MTDLTKIHEKRMLILLNTLLITFMANLDASIINVALPMIASSLKVSTELVAWSVTIYLLVIVSTILIFGRLGDIFGKSKVFLLGIFIFTLGSLFCGLADTFILLLLARAVQGLGAAAAMSTVQGIITEVFRANELGKALGMTGSFVALGAMAGPPIGGFLINYLSWHYIFFINVPVGIIAFLWGLRIMPRQSNKKVGSMKLLDWQLFKNKDFSFSIFCSFLSFTAITGSTIILPFYLQQTLQYSPATTGLILMFSPLILGVGAPLSGHLSDKIGAEILTFIGLAISSCGLVLLATLSETTAVFDILLFIGIMTGGNAIFQAPNNSLTMSYAPSNMLGMAGSVNALTRNVGMITGVTLSVFILYNKMSAYLGYPVSSYSSGQDEAFLYGLSWVYCVSALICLVGAILAGMRCYKKRSLEQSKCKK
ncbi:MAG TPA: MFS transporter [Candidatus Avacidaminococcus intestinavium]|uniref:MFS transporter n=1 Tax=Candidatus Avacidaminococcus intestinavium TaxID=2840684 RepID=A0A9D1MMZ5_9FIRM|nr:MFS transporter [Candidatus Avacidaminococcus intestinavium]